MTETNAGNRRRSGRSSWIWVGLCILLITIATGAGLARAIAPGSLAQATQVAQVDRSTLIDPNGELDRVAPEFYLGRELYLENCASCHLGVPPGLLSSQVWRTLIRDSAHYGTTIAPPKDPSLQIIWSYLKEYSRPLDEGEQAIYRVGRSRTFKALHPRVKLPEPVSLNTCIRCHPRVDFFNFRALSPEWQSAP